MSILKQIVAGVREDLAQRQQARSEADLWPLIRQAPPALDPTAAFREPGLSVISEVKRRSPSKGELADIPDPAALARLYAAGGADAISVLTESRRFGGSLEDLAAVRAAVATPVLRKDFIVDPYQILEARATGADLILLIVAALDDHQLRDLYQQATELGMTVLVETHAADEVERALQIGPNLIGVNARNLKTLEVDPATFGQLVRLIPDEVIKVAESGIADVDDARRYYNEGAQVVLVGESLVKHGDPTAAVAQMRALGR